MATESTATQLQTYLTTNFVGGTAAFKMASLKTYLENLNASINIALQKSYFQALTSGVGVGILFPTTFVAGSTYQLLWWAYDASGNSVACTITSMGIAGFSVVSAADCTFHYVAHKNN